jgi:SAM-dependent methyltransferase
MGEKAQVLDVGAGPLTVVGRQWRGGALALTAIDPLAKEYDALLDRYQLQPPVRTQSGKAEDADTLFPHASFDLVHARNCLDHAIDPFASIKKMLKLVKPGGYMYLKHHPDEALQQNWRGLHQWNFASSNEGDFIIASRASRINVTNELKKEAVVTCELRTENDEEWLIVKVKRH